MMHPARQAYVEDTEVRTVIYTPASSNFQIVHCSQCFPVSLRLDIVTLQDKWLTVLFWLLGY